LGAVQLGLRQSKPKYPIDSGRVTICDLTQQPINAIVNINMIFIVPKATYPGLFTGANSILPIVTMAKNARLAIEYLLVFT
jgi:Protein of unknown function (DUF938)